MSLVSSLLEKYDQALPRYTSYPPVPFWKGIDLRDWTASLTRCSLEKGGGLSLYVHIPYCEALCAFCGCTKVIRKERGPAAHFVDLIINEAAWKNREWRLSEQFEGLQELHLGGGSPTWLPAEQMERLLEGLKKELGSSKKGVDISIEVDPRTFTKDQADVFKKCGVNRVSFGVQDFNVETLKAIKRYQSEETVREAVRLCRERNIDSINFDLVYGLPFQTIESMKRNAQKIAEFRPSRIALYSYAHIPTLKPSQKILEKKGLPKTVEKRALYEALRQELLNLGYQEIGMDHFALPSDELHIAFKEERLHRNFMGYTVQNTSTLIGLGPSSLSDSWFAYIQNEKEVEKWIQEAEVGRFEIVNGHKLNEEDLLRRRLTLDLICHYKATLNPQLWNEIKDSEEAKDGFFSWDSENSQLEINSEAKAFIRNICSQFDVYFKKLKNDGSAAPRFSKAV